VSAERAVVILIALVAALAGALLYTSRDEIREWWQGADAHPEQAPREERGPGVVRVTDAARAAAGIVARPVAAASSQPSREVFGVVLSAQPVVEAQARHRALAGEAGSVRASLAAERVELERLRALHADDRNVSQRAVQVQEAQVKSQTARLAGVEAQMQGVVAAVRSQWGNAVATWVVDAKTRTLDDLASRRTALVQLALPDDLAAQAAELPLAVAPVGGGTARPARFVGPASSGDAALTGRTFLYAVDGTDLRAGARVVGRAQVGRERVEGVAIPREAVVRFAGKTWAYVASAKDDGRFERREVAVDTPVAGGWLNRDGWESGDHVVVAGAQLLLSEERRARAAGPDED
jgi:hypothetical protein